MTGTVVDTQSGVRDLQSSVQQMDDQSGRPMRILVISAVFPSVVEPGRGVFVKERIKAISQLADCEVRVIAPIPWFPPIKRFRRWYKWSQYPREEVVDGLHTYRPRYPLPPKIGGYIHPRLMYPVVKRIAKRINEEFPFDVIDSHFVYPSGVVAAMLGQKFRVPAVMTGRGEDMLRFPQMPIKGKRIRWALENASQLIAVSNEIAEAMRSAGADSDRISVIPNGVDVNKFHPLPQEVCRGELNLPRDRKIILSVGDRLELKGFHLLVDAMPAIRASHPNAMLAIVGGPGRFGRDYSDEIHECIRKHHLQDHVYLAGARPHAELPKWYSAADLFALMSSREGSPNVLLESLACGTPAVGTPVGGIADELSDPSMGRILDERTSKAAAREISELLSQDVSRSMIRERMESRSWQSVAEVVKERLDAVVSRGDSANDGHR